MTSFGRGEAGPLVAPEAVAVAGEEADMGDDGEACDRGCCCCFLEAGWPRAARISARERSSAVSRRAPLSPSGFCMGLGEVEERSFRRPRMPKMPLRFFFFGCGAGREEVMVFVRPTGGCDGVAGRRVPDARALPSAG